MDRQLEIVADSLSRLVPGETASSLVRRAYEECKLTGDLESVEARMTENLHARCAVAHERVQGVKKLQDGVRAFRSKPLVPHDVLAVNRQRVRQAGGLTNELKEELGMPTAAQEKSDAQKQVVERSARKSRSAQTGVSDG